MSEPGPRRAWTHDWYLMGAATGLVSTLVKSLAYKVTRRVGAANFDYGAAASGMVLGRRSRLMGKVPSMPKTASDRSLGTLTDLVYGTLFGVGTSFVITQTPKGGEVAKGAIAGTALWAANMALGSQLRLAGFANVNASQLLASLAQHVVWGASQGALIAVVASRHDDDAAYSRLGAEPQAHSGVEHRASAAAFGDYVYPSQHGHAAPSH